MPSTFGQLADRLLQDLMHMAIQCICLRVDFVCDQYPVQSINNCERERRAMGGTRVIHITRPDHKTPKQFKKYLANGRNKELLSSVFCVGLYAILEYWETSCWQYHTLMYATL